MQDECSTASGAGANGRGEPGSLSFADPTAQASYTMVFDAVLLDEDMTAMAKVVYALLSHCARKDGSCWPGHAFLQRKAGCGETKLAAALNELRARGLIRSRRRGLGRTNVYQMFTPWDRADDPSSASPRESRSVRGTVQEPCEAREKKVDAVEAERTLCASLSEYALIDERRCSEATDYRSLFGAFCTSIGRQPQGTVERGRWGKGVKALVGEATCEQVEQAVTEYRRRHPDLPCNPQAVAGQMSDLLQPRSMIRQPVAFDQRFSARARAGAESRAFEELGAAIAASKERSSRAGEGLVRLFGEDAPRLAAGGDRTRDGGGVVGDDAAMEPRRLLAGD